MSVLYLLFGSSGQVGGRLLQRLRKEPGAAIVALGRRDLDFSSASIAGGLSKIAARVDAALKGHGARVVTILSSGYTHVDGCELAPALCDRVNVVNSAAVLEWSQKNWGGKSVFFSSDYVFDGASGPYAEDAPMRPLSRYGSSKKAMEEWLNANCSDRLIVRTTGVFDVNPTSKNFLMQVLDRLKKGELVRTVNDQFSNPVWAQDLAEATAGLIRAGATGTYHAAGASFIHRAEFARAIARSFGFPNAAVHAVSTAELKQSAARPMRGGLLCGKLRHLLGWAPRGAEAALQALVEPHSNCRASCEFLSSSSEKQ